MSDNQPAYVTKWLGKYVTFVQSGVHYEGTVLDVEQYLVYDRPKLRLRILGRNGFLYPGVDEALVSQEGRRG